MGKVHVPVPPDFRDLSLDHTPLGSLADEQSNDPGVWDKYHLSQEQVDQFWENGFLSSIPVLSEEQCDKILKDYTTFLVSRITDSKDIKECCLCGVAGVPAGSFVQNYPHPPPPSLRYTNV